jgi:hypothetical protein
VRVRLLVLLCSSAQRSLPWSVRHQQKAGARQTADLAALHSAWCRPPIAPLFTITLSPPPPPPPLQGADRAPRGRRARRLGQPAGNHPRRLVRAAAAQDAVRGRAYGL